MGRHRAHSRKTTFWNELRVNNGYSYQDISTALDKDIGVVGKWFTGQCIPQKASSDEVCDLFGVDRELGYSEFKKSHETWQPGRQSKKAEALPKAEIEPTWFEPDRDPEPVVECSVENEQPRVSNDIISKMLKAVYGKFSFDDYENLRTLMLEGDDPREILYGKVSFEEYIEFLNAIK